MPVPVCEGDTPPEFQSPRNYVRTLKRYMKENGISYGALSRALGHDDSSQVSRWMNGRVEPRLSSLNEIQRALAKIVKARNP